MDHTDTDTPCVARLRGKLREAQDRYDCAADAYSAPGRPNNARRKLREAHDDVREARRALREALHNGW